RPRLLRPLAELPVCQSGTGSASLRVDPDEAPGAAEVSERTGRVARAGPVRLLRLADLEAEAPVERLVAAEVGQDSCEAGEGNRGGLVEGLRRDEGRGHELASESEQVLEWPGETGGRRALEHGAAQLEWFEHRRREVVGEGHLRLLGEKCPEHLDAGVRVDPPL